MRKTKRNIARKFKANERKPAGRKASHKPATSHRDAVAAEWSAPHW